MPHRNVPTKGGIMGGQADESDIEWQYNPRRSAADAPEYRERASSLSAQARKQYESKLDIRYGKGEQAKLDVFFADGPDAPVHVFLHGGYWRGRDKSDYSFIANALVPMGITTVVMNYDLCPATTLPAIVAQVQDGMRWLYAHTPRLQLHQRHQDSAGAAGRPPALTFSGHSAGAHLIAAALAADGGRTVIPPGGSAAAVLISGIYELEPVMAISVNDEIRLQHHQVDAMSPMRHPPSVGVPLDIIVGGGETPAWIQQSRDFADICRQQGSCRAYRELAGHNHYSIMTLLETPDGELARVIHGLVGASR